MPIFAHTETALEHITDILHDLYFTLPEGDFVPQGGVVSIRLFDKERLLRRDVMSEFQCSIHEVDSCEIGGDRKKCPDPVYFNQFRYSSRKGLLVLKACPPLQLRFRVRNLHVALAQVV